MHTADDEDQRSDVGMQNVAASGSAVSEPQQRPPLKQQEQQQESSKLVDLAMWALEHVACMALNDKDANVRLSVSHQVTALLVQMYTQSTAVRNQGNAMFTRLLQLLGRLVQDGSAKVTVPYSTCMLRMHCVIHNHKQQDAMMQGCP